MENQLVLELPAEPVRVLLNFPLRETPEETARLKSLYPYGPVTPTRPIETVEDWRARRGFRRRL